MQLPKPTHAHTTADAIVRWYDKKDELPRPHLGCSEIGRECDRALWYNFRWATTKKFDPRIKRLFDTGKREEFRFVHELRGIGATVYDLDPVTKQQIRFTGYKGHLGGSADAICKDLPEAPKTWAIAEFKTHGDKSFTALTKDGVQKAKPEHYVQMQMYMGFSKLDRALYLANNKNTDALWSEWIYFDKDVFDQHNDRAKYIIDAMEPPPGISTNSTWYQCKMCDHHAICHTDQVANTSCRTCVHATPVENGKWECAKHDKHIETIDQRNGCGSHLMLPSLVTYADVMHGNQEWIMYKDKDSGIVFANVTNKAKDVPAEVVIKLTSQELTAASRKDLAEPRVQEVKAVFPDARIMKKEPTMTAPLVDDEILF